MQNRLPEPRALLLVLTIAAVGLDAVRESSAQTVIPTRQMAFTIPFTVTPPRVAQDAPREVHLLVSEDRGASWRVAERAKPDAGEFHYRANQDGEYWYRVQTVDQSGQYAPGSEPGPEMRVLVDTEQPKLSVEARSTRQGQVEIRLHAEDPNIDPTTLILEFQPAAQQTWQPLAIDTSRLEQFLGGIQGTQSLSLNGSGPMQVRATIRDRTGNQAITQATVQQSVVTPQADPRVNAQREAEPAPGGNSLGPRYPHDDQLYHGQQGSGLPTGPTEIAPRQDRVTQQTPLDGAATNPPISQQFQPGDSSVIGIPEGIVPRYVSSNSFQLDYNVGPAVRGGVVKIDLWGTIDGGKSWKYYGTDLNRESPFPVTVPAKGLYGFRVVVYRGDATRDPLPKAGDDAHVWIAVHDPAVPPRR